MARMIAVIGANYGDEGKGLATDYFADRFRPPFVQESWTVRGNGGAQAGHTVNRDGVRHVFSHLGAGTLAGAKTYLGERFIVNPMMCEREQMELHAFAKREPEQIAVHPKARVSLDIDVHLNMLTEISRGADRHGSCGLGINETVTRTERGFGITISDFEDITYLQNFARRLTDEWIPTRINELGLDRSMNAIIWDQLHAFNVNDLYKLVGYVKMNFKPGIPTLKNNAPVIYEGAQGLMLDEHTGHFPYVTRSTTGLMSAVKVASELGITHIDPVYVTRVYTTRHGAGPLEREGVPFCAEGITITDKTNVTNKWQGDLRYAPLNVSDLCYNIHKDLDRVWDFARFFGVEIGAPKVMVTCMDQVGEWVEFITGNQKRKVAIGDVVSFMDKYLDLHVAYASYGSTAKTMKEINDPQEV